MKLNEFDPVIYPYKLWVIVDKSPKNIPSYFLDNEGNNHTEDNLEMVE